MINEAILILALVCTLAPAFLYPLLAAQDDAIEIALNGSYDTLKKAWHRNSAFIRVLVFGSLAGFYLILGALAGNTWLGLLAAVAYGSFTAALFWVIFDRRLARLRGLDPGYISRAPGAADWDKFLLSLTLAGSSDTQIARVAGRVKLVTLLVTGAGYLLLVYKLASV